MNAQNEVFNAQAELVSYFSRLRFFLPVAYLRRLQDFDASASSFQKRPPAQLVHSTKPFEFIDHLLLPSNEVLWML